MTIKYLSNLQYYNPYLNPESLSESTKNETFDNIKTTAKHSSGVMRKGWW
jgi:hypothetical protein